MLADTSYLLVGMSVRALAASANKAKKKVFAVDLFADLDTQKNSVEALSVEFDGVGLDQDSLYECMEKLDPNCEMALVYGGGFEHCPLALMPLIESRKLLGVHPRTLAKIQWSQEFAKYLAERNVCYPETRFDRPGADGVWLQKQSGGSGGVHIKYYKGGDTVESSRTYFQRLIDGKTITATLLCLGSHTKVVGYSHQWCAIDCALGPFSYGGAVSISDKELSSSMRQKIEQTAKSIAIDYGLRGLASLDMLMTEECWYFLEINPRPSATFELHEGENSFFQAHTAAFDNKFIPLRSATLDGQFFAHYVIYANQGLKIPQNWEWPKWARDLPLPAEKFEIGEPICTVYARSNDAETAKARVFSRRRQLMEKMKDW